jgi:hypothetical protein
MRPVSAASARRSAWLFASASVAALVCSSNAALASCTLNVPGGQVLAVSGDTCNVTGSYATTANGAIAGQATGVNALITGPGAGTVIFSTAGASANALQANNGGAIRLTPTLTAPATVSTSGAGSIGLLATGSVHTPGVSVASQISVQNLNLTSSGIVAAPGGLQSVAVQADTAAQSL